MLPRSLKINNAIIGLIGLDLALSRVRDDGDSPLDQAVAQVCAEVFKQNYVPPAAADKYRQAIQEEIMRLRTGGAVNDGGLTIRILGPGCVSCNNLQKLVIEIMAELEIAADIFQIHDPDEIGRFGAIPTPALVINGEVKCAGRLPTRAQIEEWLREEIVEE